MMDRSGRPIGRGRLGRPIAIQAPSRETLRHGVAGEILPSNAPDDRDQEIGGFCDRPTKRKCRGSTISPASTRGSILYAATATPNWVAPLRMAHWCVWRPAYSAASPDGN